jgi:hypothetical protein
MRTEFTTSWRRIHWTLDHRDGGEKARLFRGVLGITDADVEHLASALLEGLTSTPVTRVRDNEPHGVLCDVWITVRALAFTLIRPPWCVRPGSYGIRTIPRGWSPRTSGRNLRRAWRSSDTT